MELRLTFERPQISPELQAVEDAISEHIRRLFEARMADLEQQARERLIRQEWMVDG